MLAAVDDVELLDAWRGGRRDAGARLVERHYAAVFRFFHGKVPAAAVEDLAQQTFEVLCRRAEAFRGEGSFRSYLFGIARRVLFGWARHRRPTSDDAIAGLVAADPSPSGLLADREFEQIVATALRRLDFDDQILIELKDWEGLSQAELAALFEVPQPTVARRLQRARGRLRDGVAALIDEPGPRTAAMRNLESCMRSIRARFDALADAAAGAAGSRGP